ncbi:MAG TPA: choice-of-anchor D domain-containing protein, partial [Candidatus Kapabacteria bacterium]|nr:choice-of-anchor D domain-containing protein [Candidatus Kapabacteria bacterium]
GKLVALAAAIAFDLDKCSRQVLLNVSAVRERDQLSMPGIIDFGSIPSRLGGDTLDTVIVVRNTGDVRSAIYRIQAVPSGFAEIPDGRTNVYKDPGDTLQVHIRIPVNGCGSQEGQLVIQSRECLVDTVATIRINVIPPAPLMVRAVDMGIVCSPKDTTIYIANPNNRALRLDSIGYSTNFIFGNVPIFSDIIPPHDSIPISFEFNPAQDGNYTDTVSFHSSPCGIGTAIFTGTWGYHGLSFGTPQLLFGRGCKTDSTSETITLTNSTSRTITLASNTYTGSSRFTFDPFSLPIILKPSASKQFTILYLPALGRVDSGTFELLSSDGCVAASLALRGSREIAKAVWATPVGEFDTICPGDSNVKTFDLADRGIDSIDVLNAGVTGARFTLVQAPRTFGGAGHFYLRFTPTNAQEYYGTLNVIADSCGTSFSLPLHGSGGPAPQIVMLDSVYNFGSIAVGDSAEYCFSLTNPSCTPIDLHADSSALAGTPFQIIGAAAAMNLARGDTVNLCVQFRPGTYGLVGASLVLSSDSTTSRTIALQGTGLAPDVRFHPHLLDFGYVLRNGSKKMIVYDTNVGNLIASISSSHNNPAFVTQPVSSTLASGAGDSTAVTFTPSSLDTLVYDTLRFTWSGHSDSVILRGIGTDKGLLLSAVGLGFGSVHIGHDSTLPLYLYARNNFPTIDSITIGKSADTFSFTTMPVLSYTIRNDSDSIFASITYHAHFEQRDTSQLIIYSGANTFVVPLTARGVEAHPRVNATSIDFGSVVLGDSLTIQPVRLTNVGGYQLFVNSLAPDSIFHAFPDLPTVPIAPDSSRLFSITFRPTRARRIEQVLQFSTSSPDSVPPVLLIGTGVYPAGTGPSFGYSVASDTVEPGEIDMIPVSISGVRLAKIDADSAVLDIRFDPDMVRMLGADQGTSGAPVSRFTRLNDSTAEASVAMNAFSNGTVMRLHTQALLGSRPLTYIQVVNSNPTADQPEAAGDGAFYVADCGGAIHGVVFAGPYGTNAIVPNPVSDRADLEFTLGLDGPVAVDIYNSIGQMVKHLDAGTATAGTHSLTIGVSDLPEGRYVYHLTSLEYRAEGAMVILR